MVLELELEELKGKVDQLMDLIDLIEEDLYYSKSSQGRRFKRVFIGKINIYQKLNNRR